MGHTPAPLAIGTPYDGSTIVEVVRHDEKDTYQPFQYMLANGDIVWIPQKTDGTQHWDHETRLPRGSADGIVVVFDNDTDNKDVVAIVNPDEIEHVDTEANARLIAAAPDLLHELYTCLPFIEDAEKDPCYKPGVVRERIKAIRALLAKATA